MHLKLTGANWRHCTAEFNLMPKATHIPAVTWGERHAPGTNVPRGRGAGVRILSTATDLFARFGYNGVSTRDIASAAQVNEVTVYRHYPRKYDLYVAVLESELQQVYFRGDLLARIAEASDGRTVLERTFELLAKTLLHKPEILRLLQYSALDLNENFDPLVRRHLGELVEVLARYLEPWIKRGELRCTNAKTVILTLIGILISHNSLQRVFAGEGLSPDGMFEAYAGFTINEQAAPEESVVHKQTFDTALRGASAE
jgi:AcrR family transcriptional regulator